MRCQFAIKFLKRSSTAAWTCLKAKIYYSLHFLSPYWRAVSPAAVRALFSADNWPWVSQHKHLGLCIYFENLASTKEIMPLLRPPLEALSFGQGQFLAYTPLS